MDVASVADVAHPYRTKMRVIRTAIFPFLVFRSPETRPHFKYAKDGETWVSWILTKAAPIDRRTGKHPKSLAQLMRFCALLIGAMLAVLFFVYICFSFNGSSTFPTIGESLYWWLLGRNVFLVVLMHKMCLSVCHPNRERLKLLLFDMQKIDPALAYVGVCHFFRRLASSVMRREFKLRWFTTFLSDSILLTLLYIFFFIYTIMMIAEKETVARSLAEIVNLYKSALLLGFIICTLEFAPKVSRRKTAIFNGILLFNIAMNLSDFFLLVGEKQGQSSVQRGLGAGAQLFLTHSCVLLAAIISGHHHHTHISPDLPFKGLWKLGCVFSLGGLWFTYGLFKEEYGYSYEGEFNHNWIPRSYGYVLWGLNVVGGVICMGFAVMYCYGKHNFLQLVAIGDKAARVIDPDSDPTPQEAEDEGGSMDFDIMLIVITFVVASVYYSSEVYGFYALGEYISMLYWICAPVAPIGLATFTAVMWWRPPATTRLSLYVGLLLALCWLISLEIAEDCHLNADVPLCCEYPFVSDSNHHFEQAHEKPICAGVLDTSGNCLVNISNVGGEPYIPLQFNSVTETTRGIIVEGTLNGSALMSVQETNVEKMIQTVSCRPEEEIIVVNSAEYVLKPGCYGQYLALVPTAIATQCSEVSASCLFTVKTLNCAFIASEELTFRPVILTSLSSSEFGSLNLLGRAEQNSDKVDSTFYSLFKTMGMAALLECFFTLFGVVMKLIFLTECRSAKATKILFKRRTTVVFEVKDSHEPEDAPIQQEELVTILKPVAEDEEGEAASENVDRVLEEEVLPKTSIIIPKQRSD